MPAKRNTSDPQKSASFIDNTRILTGVDLTYADLHACQEALKKKEKNSPIVEHFFEQIMPSIKIMCLWQCGGEHDQADALTSIVCEKLVRHLHRYDRTKTTFGTWVLVLARNSLKDELRAKSRRTCDISLTGNPTTDRFEDNADEEAAHHPPSRERDPAEIAEARDFAQMVMDRFIGPNAGNATERSKAAQAFLLCSTEGMTHTEAAERLGLPLGTVKSQVRRTRIKLREELQRMTGDLHLPPSGEDNVPPDEKSSDEKPTRTR